MRVVSKLIGCISLLAPCMGQFEPTLLHVLLSGHKRLAHRLLVVLLEPVAGHPHEAKQEEPCQEGGQDILEEGYHVEHLLFVCDRGVD